MTGEITLRGRVLPIGGLKEKLLAAHRGDIRKVIIPKDNEKDLADVPANVLKNLEIILVDHVDEVLKYALLPAEQIPESINLKGPSAEGQSTVPMHSSCSGMGEIKLNP